MLLTRGRSELSFTRCSRRSVDVSSRISPSVPDALFVLSPQLLPFTEESADPIEVRLKKRQMDRIDFGPFQEMGVSDIGEFYRSFLVRRDLSLTDGFFCSVCQPRTSSIDSSARIRRQDSPLKPLSLIPGFESQRSSELTPASPRTTPSSVRPRSRTPPSEPEPERKSLLRSQLPSGRWLSTTKPTENPTDSTSTDQPRCRDSPNRNPSPNPSLNSPSVANKPPLLPRSLPSRSAPSSQRRKERAVMTSVA